MTDALRVTRLATDILEMLSVQPSAFPYEHHTFLFELELLYFAASGLRVVFDPEDVLGYCKFCISSKSFSCH